MSNISAETETPVGTTSRDVQENGPLQLSVERQPNVQIGGHEASNMEVLARILKFVPMHYIPFDADALRRVMPTMPVRPRAPQTSGHGVRQARDIFGVRRQQQHSSVPSHPVQQPGTQSLQEVFTPATLYAEFMSLKEVFNKQVMLRPTQDHPLGFLFGQPAWNNKTDFGSLVVRMLQHAMAISVSTAERVLEKGQAYVQANPPAQLDLKLKIVGWDAGSRSMCLETLRARNCGEEEAIDSAAYVFAEVVLKRPLFKYLCRPTQPYRKEILDGSMIADQVHTVLKNALEGFGVELDVMYADVCSRLERTLSGR
jgi:hypothetical protein